MGVDLIFKIAGIGIVAAVINNILEKSDKKEIATLVTLTALVIVLSLVVNMVGEFFGTLKNIFSLY